MPSLVHARGHLGSDLLDGDVGDDAVWFAGGGASSVLVWFEGGGARPVDWPIAMNTFPIIRMSIKVLTLLAEKTLIILTIWTMEYYFAMVL